MILANLINLYSYVLFARIIFSWFPVSRGGVMEQIYSVLYTITEPVLGPLRRAIPPIGSIDISPLVAFFGLNILARIVAG